MFEPPPSFFLDNETCFNFQNSQKAFSYWNVMHIGFG
uniref:Uncharacterized protein n=1 Tax=Rhizophora mucronata TaxID=61149 RepID=A0A2P2NKA8_RHIMU